MEEQIKTNVEEIHAAPEGANADVLAELRKEQNLPLGIACSLGAAVIGAVIWAAITVVTGYQIGYMAVALGFLVGTVNRFTGKGIDVVFGVAGAVLALVGCVLGNYLSIIGFTANTIDVGYLDAFSIFDFSIIADTYIENINPIDFLFYAIAGYEGFKFSFR